VLIHRLATAVVGIPIALAVIYLGGWWLTGLTALLAVGGLRELYRLLGARRQDAYRCLGYPLAGVLMLTVGLSAWRQTEAVLPALEGVLLVAAMAAGGAWLVAAAPPAPRAGSRMFTTLAAHVYVPQLLSYVVRLRALGAPSVIELRAVGWDVPAGACWLVVVMASVWGMDTAAYAVGRAIGRRKLAPAISPGKTVEGAVGGLIAAGAVAAGLGCVCGLPVHVGLLLGLAIGVVGQAGDLFESLLKRRAGVKDSGAMLPGHGGILDRFDSLLFVAPVAYFGLRAVLG
jgi:phosphatidate cytidylyltransferase